MPITNPLTGEWQFRAELTVEDRRIDGDWDSMDGGDTTSDTRTYRPGGGEPEALPAAFATGDVILERAFRAGVDAGTRNWMAQRIGRSAQVTVYATDVRGQKVAGSGETITGILKEVTRPAFRSDADGPALYRVVVTPHGNWGSPS